MPKTIEETLLESAQQFEQQGYNDDAINAYKQLIELVEEGKSNDKLKAVIAYSHLVRCLHRAEKFKEEVEWGKRAINFLLIFEEEWRDKNGISGHIYKNLCADIGTVHSRLGRACTELGQYKAAIEFQERAINWLKKSEAYFDVALTLTYLSKSYFRTGEYRKCFRAKVEALSLFKSLVKKARNRGDKDRLVRELATESDFIAKHVENIGKDGLLTEAEFGKAISGIMSQIKYLTAKSQPLDPLLLDELELLALAAKNPIDFLIYMRFSAVMNYYGWFTRLREERPRELDEKPSVSVLQRFLGTCRILLGPQEKEFKKWIKNNQSSASDAMHFKRVYIRKGKKFDLYAVVDAAYNDVKIWAREKGLRLEEE